MSLFENSSNIYFNGSSVTKAYLNGNVVWSLITPTPTPTPTDTPTPTPTDTPTPTPTPLIVPENGLLLYLDAGDSNSYSGTGNQWFDISGNNNTGTLQNSPTYSSSDGGTLSFNGSSQYVTFNTPANIPLGNSNYTISVWFNANSLGSGGFVGWGGYGGTNQVTALRLSTTGFIHYWWGNDLTIDTPISLNTWYYVVARFNGTNREIWLNNVKIANDTPGSSHNVTQSTNLTVGRTYTNEYFNGKLSNLEIYNRAISDAEMTEIYDDYYNRFFPTPTSTPTPTPTSTPTETPNPTSTPTPTPTPTNTSNLVTSNLQLQLLPSSYVGSGTVWDTTVGTTDATLSGSPTYNALSGFTFNGTSSYGRIPSVDGVTNFTNTQQYTVEIWFNPSNGQPNSGEAELLEKWNLNDEPRYPYTIRFNESTSSMSVAAYDGSNNPSVSLTGFPVNTWRQLVAVFDFGIGKTLTVYRNGVSAGSISLVGVNQVSNTSSVGIAGRVSAGGASQQVMFKGTVGIIRMYDINLTSTQVLQNFDADKSKYGL